MIDKYKIYNTSKWTSSICKCKKKLVFVYWPYRICFFLWPWRMIFFFLWPLDWMTFKNDLFCFMNLKEFFFFTFHPFYVLWSWRMTCFVLWPWGMTWFFFMTLKKDLFCPRPMPLKNDLFCHMTLINDLFVLWSGRRTCFVLWPNMTILFIYWHALHALWHVSITYMYQNNKHTTTTFRSNSLVLTCRHVDTALQDNKELQKLLT